MVRAVFAFVAVLALGLGVASSSASAASIYHGCDALAWGVGTCWDPPRPADTAAMHSCPSFSNTTASGKFDPQVGLFTGFVKIPDWGSKLA